MLGQTRGDKAKKITGVCTVDVMGFGSVVVCIGLSLEGMDADLWWVAVQGSGFAFDGDFAMRGVEHPLHRHFSRQGIVRANGKGNRNIRDVLGTINSPTGMMSVGRNGVGGEQPGRAVA